MCHQCVWRFTKFGINAYYVNRVSWNVNALVIRQNDTTLHPSICKLIIFWVKVTWGREHSLVPTAPTSDYIDDTLYSAAWRLAADCVQLKERRRATPRRILNFERANLAKESEIWKRPLRVKPSEHRCGVLLGLNRFKECELFISANDQSKWVFKDLQQGGSYRVWQRGEKIYWLCVCDDTVGSSALSAVLELLLWMPLLLMRHECCNKEGRIHYLVLFVFCLEPF